MEPITITFTPEQNKNWEYLIARLREQLGQHPKTEALLLLIGLNEVGLAPRTFKKEEKVDLMHVGTCAVLPEYYRLIGNDPDGWPHYDLIKPLPALDLFTQRSFLRMMILQWFERKYGRDFFTAA